MLNTNLESSSIAISNQDNKAIAKLMQRKLDDGVLESKHAKICEAKNFNTLEDIGVAFAESGVLDLDSFIDLFFVDCPDTKIVLVDLLKHYEINDGTNLLRYTVISGFELENNVSKDHAGNDNAEEQSTNAKLVEYIEYNLIYPGFISSYNNEEVIKVEYDFFTDKSPVDFCEVLKSLTDKKVGFLDLLACINQEYKACAGTEEAYESFFDRWSPFLFELSQAVMIKAYENNEELYGMEFPVLQYKLKDLSIDPTIKKKIIDEAEKIISFDRDPEDIEALMLSAESLEIITKAFEKNDKVFNSDKHAADCSKITDALNFWAERQIKSGNDLSPAGEISYLNPEYTAPLGIGDPDRSKKRLLH